MRNGSKSFKSCRFCALALAVPVGYLSLAAAGIIAPAVASPQGVVVEVKGEQKGASQEQVDALVASYLQVQDLLARDQFEGVKKALTEVQAAAKSLAASDNPEVAAQAKTIATHAAADPADIKEAREALKPLSAAVIGLVQVAPPSPDAAPALYVATCPMAKANWLQTTREVENPYMGKAMLRCGSVERAIREPAGSDGTRSGAQSTAGSCCPIMGS